ncbi:MAG TPA: efflux RND transporter periplasmic adaptor subunit [Deltaproteobacteria bacterium]|nr:efflux RND transporter periplasmic adaptor subunit [Deltaproteobacteria bacterium]
MDKNHISHICFFILILALLATYGCNDNNTQAQQTLLEENGKPQVKTAVVELRGFQSHIEASGTLMPVRHAKLTTLVGGKLETINADIGDSVTRGDILFQVRTVDYELALKQAEASLSRAEIMVEDKKREKTRIANLFQGGSATEQMRDQAITAFEDATSALKQAVATRDKARQALADCTVRAPFTGEITAKYLQEGEFTGAGTEVLEIMDLSTINAEINVSERHAGKIGQGTTVTISPSSGTTPVEGSIVAVNPKIDLTARTFLVKVQVDNTDRALQAGLFCTALFTLPVAQNQTAIPSSALSRDQGKSTVWLVEDGNVYQKEVSDSGIHDGWAWITGGLEQGQTVVVEGAGNLIQGQKVEIKN